jgi:histone H3/H4
MDPPAKRSRSEGTLSEEAAIMQMLDASGSTYDRSVVNQLVEAVHAYTKDILGEAHDYAFHAGRKVTEISDLKVALQTRALAQKVASREVWPFYGCCIAVNPNIDIIIIIQYMADLALEVNAIKIPAIEGKAALIRLPPRDSLLTRPFRIALPDEVSGPVVNSEFKERAKFRYVIVICCISSPP